MTEFSVVIPTLDEEDRIGGALASARRALGPGAELLVVDGGSRDATRRRAAGRARVLTAGPGRGTQLDAGARAARGRVLVFLHADSRLPPDAGAAIRRALARPGAVAGCFRFALAPPAPPLSRWALLEAAVRLRTRLFRTATGDQTIFAEREAYRAAGGAPHWELFEDVELVRRLREAGRFVLLETAAPTSRRRWERGGFWRTVARHLLLRAGYRLGVAPERLARRYRPAERDGGRGERARRAG